MSTSPELLVYKTLVERMDEWILGGQVQTLQAAKIAVQTLEEHGEFVVLLQCPDCGREQVGTG